MVAFPVESILKDFNIPMEHIVEYMFLFILKIPTTIISLFLVYVARGSIKKTAELCVGNLLFSFFILILIGFLSVPVFMLVLWCIFIAPWGT